MSKLRAACLIGLFTLAGCAADHNLLEPGYDHKVATLKAAVKENRLPVITASIDKPLEVLPLPPPEPAATAPAKGAKAKKEAAVPPPPPPPPPPKVYFADAEVALIEKAEVWWAGNTNPAPGANAPFTIVVENNATKPIKGFTYRLADLDCGKGGDAVSYDLVLAQPILQSAKAAVTIDLPIGANSAMRKGQLSCGEIKRVW